MSGDSLDWLECRLNGDRGGCVLTTSTSTGDSVTISGFVIENGYGEYQIQSNSGGLTIRDGIHLNVRHLVFQNNEQSPGLSRGRSIFGSSSSSSARLQDIRIQSDSLTNGLEQVALWMGRGLEIDRLWIDGTHDQGRAAHLDGDPLRVRHMQVRGYSDVPQFWVKFGSDGIMDLDDVLIRDNSATGDFQVFAGPRFRAPSVRGFVFEGNQHLAPCGGSPLEAMLWFLGDSLKVDNLIVRNNYEHCQHVLGLRSEESTGLVRHLVYEGNRVGNGVWPEDEGPIAYRGQHITMLDVSLDSCRFGGNITELAHDPQHPERAVAIFGALIDLYQQRDLDSLTINQCEFQENLLIDPDDYSIHTRAANDGRCLYVRQYGGVGLRVSKCLFESNAQPNHCPESGLSSLGSVFYLYEYNDGQTGNLLENLVFRDNDDGTLTTTYDSRGVMRNIQLYQNRRRGVFAGALSWVMENILVDGQQAEDLATPISASWQAALSMNCFDSGEMRNCTVVNSDVPFIVKPSYGDYSQTVIRNLAVSNCQFIELEHEQSDPGQQVWAQWEYCYLPVVPHTMGPGIVVDSAWPFDPDIEGGFLPALNGSLVDGGDPDTTYDDIEDPENPGFALWPSQGNLRNDIGYTGGPHAGTLEHLVAVRSPRKALVTQPSTFVLHPAHPNPFNPVTTLGYVLNRPLQVELSVYNVLGQKVRTLVSGLESAGEHHVQWDAGDLASGVYIVKLSAGGESRTQKILLLK
ncbi:MAG: T9SS type A sorting domain-containing protein [Candidatus Delongbacteria bacterium]|nr:T9SS type A sorting domain-containing protein [Candidatus Delongbacteria bacterium]